MQVYRLKILSNLKVQKIETLIKWLVQTPTMRIENYNHLMS